MPILPNATVVKTESLGGHSNGVPKLLLSRDEAAAALSVCPRTLDAIASQGRIPAVKIGRRVLFSVEALRSWISQQEAVSAKAGGTQC